MDQPDQRHVFLDSAWRHFTIHAEQRLKMFQFYITISTAMLGGGFLLIRSGQNSSALMLLGFLASFFSFVFWKFEVRTRNLIKNAEDAIKYLEGFYDVPDVDSEPNPLKVFTRDDVRTEKSRRRCTLWYFSYRKCFVLVFAVIGLLGVLGMVYSLNEIVRTKPAVELPL